MNTTETPFFVYVVVGAALGVLLAVGVSELRDRPAPHRYVRVEIEYSTYFKYLSTRVGPYYRHAYECRHALPSNGIETLGHWTRRLEYGCVRVMRN